MAEAVRGRCWAEMAEAWGDWGRDGTICVMVRHGQQRLTEGVRAVEGLKYGSAAQAVRRFAAALLQDAAKMRFVAEMKHRLGKRIEAGSC